MSTVIPEEIKLKAEELRPKGQNRGVRWKEGFYAGYSLSLETIAEKDNEIEILKRTISAYKTLQDSGDKIRAHQTKLLSEAKTVDSEREMNDILTGELETKDIRIRELEEAIIDIHDNLILGNVAEADSKATKALESKIK